MSDSDSTWPATDDFGSRFLEIDEYECPQYTECEPLVQSSRQRSSSKRTASTVIPLPRRNESRRTRGLRTRSYLAMEEGRDESDDDKGIEGPVSSTRSRRLSSTTRVKSEQEEDPSEEEEAKAPGFLKPKLLTARQRSMQKQREAEADTNTSAEISKRSAPESDLLTLESLEPPRRNVKPTPEQLVKRERSIARRRESAKHRAEMEKRQTVERLLKVNADSDGFIKRARGRGPRGSIRGFSHSASVTSLLSTSSNMSGGYDESESTTVRLDEDEDDSEQDTTSEAADLDLVNRIAMAKEHGLNDSVMDPSCNYIRSISSLRLSPSNRVCFPLNSDTLFNLPISKESPPVPQPRLCALGCGRPRRYTCSTTGVPLCSLACYKQNMANTVTQNTTTLVS